MSPEDEFTILSKANLPGLGKYLANARPIITGPSGPMAVRPSVTRITSAATPKSKNNELGDDRRSFSSGDEAMMTSFFPPYMSMTSEAKRMNSVFDGDEKGVEDFPMAFPELTRPGKTTNNFYSSTLPSVAVSTTRKTPTIFTTVTPRPKLPEIYNFETAVQPTSTSRPASTSRPVTTKLPSHDAANKNGGSKKNYNGDAVVVGHPAVDDDNVNYKVPDFKKYFGATAGQGN